jgi:ribosomal protein S12 methylthiotransferase RimO
MSAAGEISESASRPPAAGRVAVVTLGCARNEVDSEELAARLAAGGWQVTPDGTDADVVLVNTCGFIDKAKQDSIDTLLAAADTGAKVVAAGCLAERYGRQLAENLPEASAVLGFSDYPDIARQIAAVAAGKTLTSHEPRDRRTLPLLASQPDSAVPRQRLTSGPVAPLKLASGCDRRCAFCAIPSFRGRFVSRKPDEILAEAQWLAGEGVRELVLVSENSTSYGKDLGDLRLLERLLPELAAIGGIVRIRVAYLQPAEIRPTLIEAIATTPGVAAYFDLSFQHASESVLRRMRRFGSVERFLDLVNSVRDIEQDAGIRSNVIVGFPGETRTDVADLERFLTEARLDAIGVFDYSDEEGTEAASLPDKVAQRTIDRRYARLCALAEELAAQRAADRVGSTIEVLVDSLNSQPDEPGTIEGRAAHQAPEVDGLTRLVTAVGRPGTPGVAESIPLSDLRPGDLVRCQVVDNSGVDLVAVPLAVISAAGSHGDSTDHREPDPR